MASRRKHSHACKATISDAMGMATSKSVLQISSVFVLLATRGSRRLRPLLLPLLLPFPLPPGAGKHTPGPTQKICPSPCCPRVATPGPTQKFCPSPCCSRVATLVPRHAAKECRRLRLRLRLGVVLGEEGLPLSCRQGGRRERRCRQGLTRLI